MTLPRRLQEALARRGKSIRWLQEELKSLRVPASSYGSVRSYVKGDAAPRDDWLQAASAVLGVRTEWLARGDGEMTHPEQQAVHKAEEDGESLLARLSEGVLPSRVDALLSEVATVVAQTVDDYDLPHEFRVSLRAFLVKVFAGKMLENPEEVEAILSGGGDSQRFLPEVKAIRKYIDGHFGPKTLNIYGKTHGEALAALYSQLSVLLLAHFGSQTSASRYEMPGDVTKGRDK